MFRRFLKNGKKFLTSEQSDILSASAVMMAILTITKIVGVLTKTVAVSQLGTEKYGLFIAANTLPETLSMIFIFGTITAVIIPILVEELQAKKNGSFSKIFSSIVNIGLSIFLLISILVALFSGYVTPIIIKKIANPIEPFSQEQIDQIVSMMRWLMLPQIILGISTFLSSALNAFKRFIVPQLAPLFYNLGILVGAIILIPLLDGSPWGLTWGILIGSVLHLLIQLPLSSHLKIKYRLFIDLKSKRLREIIKIGFPRIVTLAADQIAIFIDRIIAIGLGAAPLGAYYLAVSLVTIPYSLFSATFSVASLPHLSEKYAKGDIKSFKRIFSKVFNQILFLSIPVTMILLVLRLPIVRLLYGILGREFTWGNTLMVAWIVFFFSLGLIPEILIAFINRAFCATCDTLRPLFVGIFIVLGGIFTGILFTNYFSHIDYFSLREITWDPNYFLSKAEGAPAIGGLAFSSSLVYSTAFVFLIALFTKKIGGLSFKKFWLPSIKKMFFGIVMAFFMYMLFKIWDGVLDTARTINVLVLTISTIVPGLCVYLWFSFVFRDPEIEIITKLIDSITRFIQQKKMPQV